MSELAPALSAAVRRRRRLEQVRRRQEQISVLQTRQRLELAALATEDLAGLSRRYVADELALVLGLSVRQAQNRCEQAQCFAAFPAVHARVGDGTWLLEHADAVVDELAGSGLEHAAQQQVLDLVLSRPTGRTPWELRQAVRTAVVVLFPEHVLDRAEKATLDRDVQSYLDAPGAATLLAHGPAAAIAEMMACLDAMTCAPAAQDPRNLGQRRFDTLRELIRGQLQPGSWQAHLLITLATVEGREELPAEIPGFGPIPAAQAREILTQGATLRRVVVDEHGQLLAVDDRVHRPDLPPTPAAPGRSDLTPPDDPDDDPDLDDPDFDDPDLDDADFEDGEPDPDGTGGTPHPPAPDAGPGPAPAEPEAPTRDDFSWLEDNTDRTLLYTNLDQHREAAGCPSTTTPGTLGTPSHTRTSATTATETKACPQPPSPTWQWSATALTTALQRLRTDPLRSLDLSTDRYAIPKRLKRFLELRDRTCVFPGCTRLALRCDKDHLIPWPRGRTTAHNLADECEHHHQGKHDSLTVQRLPDGTFRWTTPAGITGDQPPRPVLTAWTYRPPPDNR